MTQMPVGPVTVTAGKAAVQVAREHQEIPALEIRGATTAEDNLVTMEMLVGFLAIVAGMGLAATAGLMVGARTAVKAVVPAVNRAVVPLILERLEARILALEELIAFHDKAITTLQTTRSAPFSPIDLDALEAELDPTKQ